MFYLSGRKRPYLNFLLPNILYTCYTLSKYNHLIYVLYLLVTISFILYYLNYFNLLIYTIRRVGYARKFLIIFIIIILIVLFLFINKNLVCSDIILCVNDNNSDNNIHLHKHVFLYKKAGKTIGKSIASNIGLKKHI